MYGVCVELGEFGVAVLLQILTAAHITVVATLDMDGQVTLAQHIVQSRNMRTKNIIDYHRP